MAGIFGTIPMDQLENPNGYLFGSNMFGSGPNGTPNPNSFNWGNMQSPQFRQNLFGTTPPPATPPPLSVLNRPTQQWLAPPPAPPKPPPVGNSGIPTYVMQNGVPTLAGVGSPFTPQQMQQQYQQQMMQQLLMGGGGGGGFPGQPGFGPSAGTPSSGLTADQVLASWAGNQDYLKGFMSNQGYPTQVTPAWTSMVDAMQRNIQRGAANLEEQFGVSGNRFSTSFGTAATDYQTQTQKDQNSLLAQMTLSSDEAAKQRMLSAATSLGGYGYGATSQLASQDFNSQMLQQQQALQAALALGSGSSAALNQLSGLGSSAANTLLLNSILGTQGLFGASNQAATGLYGGSLNALPQWMAYDQAIRGQALGAAGNLANLWGTNLSMGSQLGQQQYSTQQNAINNAYQEWLRTQPYNNPLLSMIYTATTSYPPYYQPQRTPGFWDYFSQIASAGLGAAGAIWGGGR